MGVVLRVEGQGCTEDTEGARPVTKTLSISRANVSLKAVTELPSTNCASASQAGILHKIISWPGKIVFKPTQTLHNPPSRVQPS